MRSPPRPIAMRVYDRKRGEVFLPDTKTKIQPKFLHGASPATDRYGNRREMLANWILSPDNKYFSQALVNRMWGHFFGSAFVNPVDDFNATNLPSHPEVLALLAEDFKQNGYDLKRLIRIIVNTDVYKQASTFSRNNAEDHRHYSRALMRPMSPEQLFYSLMRVTDYEEQMEKVAKKQEERMKRRMKEQGEDAMMGNVSFIDRALERFTVVFENDEMGEAVDFTSTITQALYLMNGDMSNERIEGKRGTVFRILQKYESETRRIEEIFLMTLSRLPTRAELRLYSTYVRRLRGSQEAYEDIFWVQVNSSEFFFNH